MDEIIKINSFFPSLPQAETKLTSDELHAIGEIIIQWAYLEHALLIKALILSRNDNSATLPKGIDSPVFAERFKSLILLAKNNGVIERVTNLISEICNLESDRHKITHGLWIRDSSDLKKLIVSSFRTGLSFTESFDLAKLIEVGTKIAEINFMLTFPDGLKDVQPFPHISRLINLGLGKVERADPSPTLAIPPNFFDSI